MRFEIALLFEVLVLERRLGFAKEGREEASAGRRRRRRKRCRSRRGCACGGGSRVGVRAISRGLSQELNPGQTVPNGRCYHYTTKPSRVKDAGARLVG